LQLIARQMIPCNSIFRNPVLEIWLEKFELKNLDEPKKIREKKDS